MQPYRYREQKNSKGLFFFFFFFLLYCFFLQQQQQKNAEATREKKQPNKKRSKKNREENKRNGCPFALQLDSFSSYLEENNNCPNKKNKAKQQTSQKEEAESFLFVPCLLLIFFHLTPFPSSSTLISFSRTFFLLVAIRTTTQRLTHRLVSCSCDVCQTLIRIFFFLSTKSNKKGTTTTTTTILNVYRYIYAAIFLFLYFTLPIRRTYAHASGSLPADMHPLSHVPRQTRRREVG